MDIKPLDDNGDWGDKQIQTLSYGGNSRFDEFLEPYLKELDSDKYNTDVFSLKAAEFYRKRLHAFANVGYFSEAPPDPKEGAKYVLPGVAEGLDQAIQDTDLLDLHKDEKLMKIEDEDVAPIDKLDAQFKEFLEVTGDIFQEHSKKAWESTAEFRERTGKTAREVWASTGDVTKSAYDRTKTVAGSAWDKTGEFFTMLGQKASQTVDDIKRSDTYKKVSDTTEHQAENLGFKKLFGWFKSNEEVKEQPPTPEEQYFDFDKNNEPEQPQAQKQEGNSRDESSEEAKEKKRENANLLDM